MVRFAGRARGIVRRDPGAAGEGVMTAALQKDGLSLFVPAFDRMLAATALRIGSARRPA
jgi:hypothetical protein